jgi:hypothetical protein
MGAVAEAMSRFAQPLIDATDGSQEDLQRALSLSQLCWNMALLPEEKRDQFLADMQPALKMDDEEFHGFKRDVVLPMIRRHQEMFPEMQHLGTTGRPNPPGTHEVSLALRRRPAKQYAGTGRNERCPCGSGKKYKVCCGR